MKKILLVLILSFLSLNQTFAQEAKDQNPANRPNLDNLSSEKKELLKKENERHRQEMKNITGVEMPAPENGAKLSPQQREELMKKNREIFENLPADKKELLKKENERHRQEMKTITGFDFENRNNRPNFSENRPKKCQEPSPEERENHRKLMENLSADKKALIKKEMDRHFQEMKNITGFEMPRPKCDQQS